MLLDAGEWIRALAEYLGHAEPEFTLRVYAPDAASEERTARAVDQTLRGGTLVDGSTGCGQMCIRGETCPRRRDGVAC